MKIAIAYDHVNKIGGAERILTALHELYPQAPLYTPFFAPENASWTKGWQVITSSFNRLPFASRHHELYPGLPILAWEGFSFNDYDLVISVTSAEAKGIITGPNTKHISYVLTPTRYLWSGYYDYFTNPVFRAVSAPFVSYLRTWDTIAAQRPDHFIAISETVKRRITKYYHRESTVIYPPVDTEFFVPQEQSGNDYFLVVSRLVDYKHIDLIIRACNQQKLALKIVGTGNAEAELKQLAGKTIDFVGQVSEAELLTLYQNARALIYMADEDFGISMVEALSCGKPVIAFGRGGALEIVGDDGGILFEEQSVPSLERVLAKFEKVRYNSASLRQVAQKFAKQRFMHAFGEFVQKLYYKNKSIL
ncbi:glycosyltransferase family 4 protein [Candidatus Microgenomates bacterium]|nr:MAG: glycosyltransferase family 4 protein [Candidatus Microgenomates bacterium]